VCRATHSTPGALDDLDATDVELMWRAARGEAEGSTSESSEGMRILIVPDRGAPASEGLRGLEEPAVPVVQSRPEPLATAAPVAHAASATLPTSPSGATPAPLAPPDTAGHARPAPTAIPASREDPQRATATSRSVARSGGRFRVSLGGVALAPPAVVPPGVAEPGGATMPAASQPHPWPWPVRGHSVTAETLDPAARHAGAPAAASPRSSVASSPPAAHSAPAPAFAAPPPAAATLGLADDILDELAVRLEQAAGELGIDLEA